MKILVLSDSHGGFTAMCRAMDIVQPQQVLFLGDGQRDFEKLQSAYPMIPMVGVPGNCDYGVLSEPEHLLELEGVRILMMHGHTRGVKYDTMRAVYAARECGAQVLLYGHTHQAELDYDGSLWVMNPGAIGDRTRASYGVITIANGNTICSLYRLEP